MCVFVGGGARLRHLGRRGQTKHKEVLETDQATIGCAGTSVLTNIPATAGTVSIWAYVIPIILVILGIAICVFMRNRAQNAQMHQMAIMQSQGQYGNTMGNNPNNPVAIPMLKPFYVLTLALALAAAHTDITFDKNYQGAPYGQPVYGQPGQPYGQQQGGMGTGTALALGLGGGLLGGWALGSAMDGMDGGGWGGGGDGGDMAGDVGL